MFWLKQYTNNIRSLLEVGDEKSLVYAALEARLAIERVCYERLRMAHDYISPDDLRTWKPQYIVETLIAAVDPRISQEWTLSIGSEPGEDPEKYLPLGTQKGFNPKELNRLWQAMSSFLHTSLPRNSKDNISHYKSAVITRPKIEEALVELERLSEGTIASALVFETISFHCDCGQVNKRAKEVLANDAIVNCINEKCREQYQVEIKQGEYTFKSLTLAIQCCECETTHYFPQRGLIEMKNNERGKFHCKNCNAENIFMWKLMQVKKI